MKTFLRHPDQLEDNRLNLIDEFKTKVYYYLEKI